MIWKHYDDDDDQGDFDDNRPKGGCAVSYVNNTVYPLSPLYYHHDHLDHHHRHNISRSFEFVGKRVRPFSCPTHKYFKMDDVKAKVWFKLVV